MSESSPSPAQKTSQAARIEQWITLAVLAILVAGCYLVLQPFLTALIWALVLCCTTWPAFVALQRVTRGNVALAALVSTLAIALVALAPFVIVGISLVENANQLLEHGKRLIDQGPPTRLRGSLASHSSARVCRPTGPASRMTARACSRI